jgi:hypothetical protein
MFVTSVNVTFNVTVTDTPVRRRVFQGFHADQVFEEPT